MDGYRRLARTRRDDGAPVEVHAEPRPRRARGRLLGALRLTGFVAVVALIVGTSVSLALTDPQDARQTKVRAADVPAAVVEPVVADEPEEVATDASDDDAPRGRAVDTKEAPAPTPVAAAPEPAEASAPAPVTAAAQAPQPLPLTGPSLLQHVLLGGSALVLVGMLVQIAGQPLPASASASSRTRRASRLT